MQVANKRTLKFDRRTVGYLLIIYSAIHHLLFGFDFWVVLFAFMGCFKIFSARPKKDNKVDPKP
jgi:hypothetical protein